jgi:GTPase SAR1 family protein
MKPEEEVQPQAEKPEEELHEEIQEPAPSSSLPSKYKIVFLGDTFVGKTCLINRFMYDTFNENYQVSTELIS